ncbi:MAG: 2-hydroxymuconate tautomerase family protein [Actinobacteria bacterium]|nr:2-hydroxymuconate tautomerase family protein [Actinomycetota bacterium]
MPVIVVQMLAGRTPDQKRRIVAGITKVMQESAGAAPDSTTVIIQDVARDNWAKGGALLSEQTT